LAYQFAPSAHVQSGRYVQLGNDGADAYLQACRPGSSIVAVNDDFIVSEMNIRREPPGATPPDLIQMIFLGKSPGIGIGYQPLC
jgi:hypothetical protein